MSNPLPLGHTWGTPQWPLFNDFYRQCPTARFVGGASRYLCECSEPWTCDGAKAAQDLLKRLGVR